jgi:hypothetical protein
VRQASALLTMRYHARAMWRAFYYSALDRLLALYDRLCEWWRGFLKRNWADDEPVVVAFDPRTVWHAAGRTDYEIVDDFLSQVEPTMRQLR